MGGEGEVGQRSKPSRTATSSKKTKKIEIKKQIGEETQGTGVAVVFDKMKRVTNGRQGWILEPRDGPNQKLTATRAKVMKGN